ncbi:MAG: hypothetical protein JW828_11930 [Sedimentisphaerales bacterium]|nr:hypothetical protein [Sedimentisphaerales bacterium]
MIRLHEYRRVIGMGQVLYLAGRKLKRQGIRYTTVAAVIGIGAIVTDMAGNRIFGFDLKVSKLDAALLPALVAFLTFGLGHGLIGISNLFSSERLLIADANSLNLMEDRKKTDMAWHLGVLWDRVFQYEARLRNHGLVNDEADRIRCGHDKLRAVISSMDEDCRRYFGITEANLNDFIEYIDSFQPLSADMEQTREGFIATASFALQRSMPQKLERSLTGFDLSLLEDWYDGAFFTADDNKLQRQFAGNRAIYGIREKIGIPWSLKAKEMLFGHPVPLWHGLTMKKIGICVGTQIARMNKLYTKSTEPDFFDAQDFLWKDDRQDALILKVFAEDGPQVLEDLHNTRRVMFREIFSHRRASAHEQIFRMFGSDFVRAMNLRLCFDIEFAAGALDNTPGQDIQDMEQIFPCTIYPTKKWTCKSEKAEQLLIGIDEFIAASMPEIRDEPLLVRTTRIGWFINIGQVRTVSVAHPSQAVEIFRATILPCQRQYSRRLCMLRQHYELARLQLLSYIKMVDEMAEYDKNGS